MRNSRTSSLAGEERSGRVQWLAGAAVVVDGRCLGDRCSPVASPALFFAGGVRRWEALVAALTLLFSRPRRKRVRGDAAWSSLAGAYCFHRWSLLLRSPGCFHAGCAVSPTVTARKEGERERWRLHGGREEEEGDGEEERRLPPVAFPGKW
ncbi:hypothetical protein AABB24_030037 [Solanum stoloniferum]|uniref:Uncharacterized protein n=1 Tax=Solanum stoloniferum TaxID=62892 RepID=A0ABD2S115_9SOLN